MHSWHINNPNSSHFICSWWGLGKNRWMKQTHNRELANSEPRSDNHHALTRKMTVMAPRNICVSGLSSWPHQLNMYQLFNRANVELCLCQAWVTANLPVPLAQINMYKSWIFDAYILLAVKWFSSPVSAFCISLPLKKWNKHISFLHMPNICHIEFPSSYQTTCVHRLWTQISSYTFVSDSQW